MLSKARARWGKGKCLRVFLSTIAQCVEAGLVGGSKPYIDATAWLMPMLRKSRSSSATPEFGIAALKQAYRATESKLEDSTTPESYQAVNDG